MAIILVFFSHYRIGGCPEWVTIPGDIGWSGVDLFFVLSGYLIGGQLFKLIAAGKPISYSDFYRKRFFRIIPAYAVVLAMYYAIPGFREREALSPLWKFLTFTQNLGLNIKTNGTFSHAWSLCIEEQFYLVLPLVMMWLLATNRLKWGWTLLPILLAAGLAARYYCWEHFVAPVQGENYVEYYQWIYYPTYARLDGLLSGIGIAAIYHFRPARWQAITKHGNRLLAAGVAVLATGLYLSREQVSFGAVVFGFPVVAIGYGIMTMGALSPDCVLSKYPLSISTAIAMLSYSIYLIHKQLNHLLKVLAVAHGYSVENSWLFWVCLLVAIAAATVLHLVVERPLMRWGRSKAFAKGANKSE